MGLYSNAQQNLPSVLAIPEEVDAVKILIENRADELVCGLKTGDLAHASELLRQMEANLQLEPGVQPALDMQIVSTRDRGSYSIHNIIFQSMEGVYIPANLYVPKGKGPFPAALNSHGHWAPGRRSEVVQLTSQILALNGYVCLSIDAMGSGERGRNHQHEYHGANLGSSLLDLGTPLMGIQLLENRRAIDLLCTLPYVDQDRIGATGASGGGNQTMWLAAADPRVKAAVPVVSTGTFRSYIMNSNCVCELHPNGLLHFEEGQLLQAMAPKAIKIITALKDGNAAFNVHQMLKSFRMAKRAYQQQGAGDRIDYELFDEPHSYTTAMNLSMLQWFDKAFDHTSSPSETIGFVELLDTAELAVLDHAVDRTNIMTIPEFVQREFDKIQERILTQEMVKKETKKHHLRQLLSKVEPDQLLRAQSLEPKEGWQRIVLETANQQLIPIRFKAPKNESKTIHIFFPSGRKQTFTNHNMEDLIDQGEGVAVVDLLGLGERASTYGDHMDGALPRFHTVSRSLIWVGETMMGIWQQEIGLVTAYLHQENKESKLIVIADHETAMAVLMYRALSTIDQEFALWQLPISFVPDQLGKLDHYNMAIHIPGILKWGDIPMLLALSDAPITLNEMSTIGGKHCEELDKKQLEEKVNAYKRKFN